MATKTSTAEVGVSQQPKYLVTAPIRRVFTHFETATLSAGDIILMPQAQIPHGAHITDIRVGGGLRDSTTGAIIRPGIDVGATTSYFGTLTLSVAGRIPTTVVGPTTASEAAAIPFTVSVSDDAAIRYATLRFQVQAATSATTSASLVFIVDYVMDK